jgi:aspartate aminotransferase
MPSLSDHLQSRQPSEIRKAQILFAERADKDEVEVVNLAIGNVGRAIHPALKKRMDALTEIPSPFADGVVRYSASAGLEETQQAFLNLLTIDGLDTEGLGCVITDGGSMAMELMVLATCGPKSERPLLLVEPAYTNYKSMAERAGVPTVSISRVLDEDGTFHPPDLEALDAILEQEQPAALVVIPADNPTGQYLSRETLVKIAQLTVKHDIWLVSDEAYRQLHYTGGAASSIWSITEDDVPGITGSRIGIESASKVWNACGLRVGALITDNSELRDRCVAEYTANLCSNVIGQWIFGALAHESGAQLRAWCDEQRGYYQKLMREVNDELTSRLPGLIASRPDAALYTVLDVRNIAPDGFDAGAFVKRCATEGRVDLDGRPHTLLVSPMAGFYSGEAKVAARTQMRMAFVEPPEKMAKVGALFEALFKRFGA